MMIKIFPIRYYTLNFQSFCGTNRLTKYKIVKFKLRTFIELLNSFYSDSR